MLSTEINSKAELISIAVAAQRMAIQRYTQLASRMREHGNDGSAEVFEKLVAKDQTYLARIIEWATLEDLVIDADATPGEWDDPNVVTSYDVQARNPFRSTPYKAFAYAVHNDERAFLFYTYVAADSPDPDICRYARALAREELGRAASLRGLRRQAWHAQSQQVSNSRIDPGVVKCVPDLLAVIIFIEQYLGRLFRLAGSQFSELEHLAQSTRESLVAAEKALRAGELPGVRVTGELKKVGVWRDAMLSETKDASAALRRLLTDCDRSFAFYNLVVKASQVEAVMFMAQRHSALATQRIAELSHITRKKT